MRHPAYSKLDEDAGKLLTAQLSRLLILTDHGESERKKLGRTMHRLALAVEGDCKGTLEMVESWIVAQKLHTPVYQKSANGVVLPPESFRFAGFGPARYDHHCPPQDAVGVYVKGNSKNRSHRMVAEFEWDLPLPDNVGLMLHLRGQVSSSGAITPEIRILVNGIEIYSGGADFVADNWSSQSFKILDGVVKQGMNSIEIENISHPLSIIRWNQRWCLISNAEIVIQQNGAEAASGKF